MHFKHPNVHVQVKYLWPYFLEIHVHICAFFDDVLLFSQSVLVYEYGYDHECHCILNFIIICCTLQSLLYTLTSNTFRLIMLLPSIRCIDMLQFYHFILMLCWLTWMCVFYLQLGQLWTRIHLQLWCIHSARSRKWWSVPVFVLWTVYNIVHIIWYTVMRQVSWSAQN